MAPLPLLATVDDLKALLRQPDLPAATGQLALKMASGVVRRYTRQTISRVPDDSVLLEPYSLTVIRLPQRPVVSVASVTAGGQPVGGWRLSGDDLVSATGWSGPVTVVYTHGYTEVPDDIVAIVLDLAANTLVNPDGLRQESISDYSRTFATETLGAGNLSKKHRLTLDTYRRGAFSVVPA